MTSLSRRAVTKSFVASALLVSPAARASAGEDIAAFARGLVNEGAPGASAAVIGRSGGVQLAAAGFADVERHLVMTPATRLMSGSTGKTFCAAAAMALVSQGLLALDEAVAPYFKDESWFAGLPNAPRLTPRLLLMHASGFPQFLDVPEFLQTFMGDSIAGRETGYSPQRMLAFIDGKPPAAPLGQHHYSDLNYDLVALTMEKVTGRRYYDLLQELVIRRLGVGDVVPANRRNIPNLACGYASGNEMAAKAGMTGRTTDMHGVLRHDPSLEFAGGGLALTPRALALLYWKLPRGEIVPKAAFDEMLSSRLPLPDGTEGAKIAYGLGVFITERPGLGRYISHSGYYPGYHANVGGFLDHGFSAAFQVNTDTGPDVNNGLRALAREVIARVA